MNKTTKELGIRIKLRRKELGMNQLDLAIRTGYNSRASISMIESGQVDLSQTKLKLFASALNTTPIYLLFGDDAPVQEPSLDEIETEIIELVKQLCVKDKLEIYYLLKSKKEGK